MIGDRQMKKFLPLVALLIAVYIGWVQLEQPIDSTRLGDRGNNALVSAYQEHKSGVQVTGDGIVIKVLPDDNKGSRHQRFLLRLESGQTLLIAHNIDLAPRISSLKKGDSVAFNGEFEWNEKGGVVHWTHHDPKGRHVDGWLKHKGQTFQ